MPASQTRLGAGLEYILQQKKPREAERRVVRISKFKRKDPERRIEVSGIPESAKMMYRIFRVHQKEFSRHDLEKS